MCFQHRDVFRHDHPLYSLMRMRQRYRSRHIYVKPHVFFGKVYFMQKRALDRLFRALADPTRLRLINLMADQEICVCYFVEVLDVPQPKISRHLAYLRNAGIVSARRNGKWMHYCLQVPSDPHCAAILRTTVESLKADKVLQRDFQRLERACCGPKSLNQILGAPLPCDVAATS
jgi:ArsR family transcriptional regulator, arsenate/arsenite/antimonite-responsive transcriptional repressor